MLDTSPDRSKHRLSRGTRPLRGVANWIPSPIAKWLMGQARCHTSPRKTRVSSVSREICPAYLSPFLGVATRVPRSAPGKSIKSYSYTNVYDLDHRGVGRFVDFDRNEVLIVARRPSAKRTSARSFDDRAQSVWPTVLGPRTSGRSRDQPICEAPEGPELNAGRWEE